MKCEGKVTTVVILTVAVFWVMIGVGIYNHAMSAEPNVTGVIIERPTPRQTIGPDIKHCYDPDEQRSLWDCIRHKQFKRMRRTDI